MTCAILFNSENLTICIPNSVVLVDNAGVIVNPKGEMKGTLQIICKFYVSNDAYC